MRSHRSVSTYMTEAPFAAAPTASLRMARHLMEKHHLADLPVEADGRLVGVLSKRDLEIVWWLAPLPPDMLTVEDAMMSNPYTVEPSAALDEVVGEMRKWKIGSAVVLESGHVVGIFTANDALDALADILGEHVEEALEANREAPLLLPAAPAVEHVPSPEEVFAAVVGIFCERLSRGEARKLLHGLPEGLRQLVARGVLDRAEPPVLFGRDELVLRVAVRLGVDPARAEELVQVVLGAVKEVLPRKPAHDVACQLPEDLKELWAQCA